jgi:hypothetical protein
MLTAAVFPDATMPPIGGFKTGAAGSKRSARRHLPDGLHHRSSALPHADCQRRTSCGQRPVWAGIGAFQLSPSATIENIRAARQLGAEGVVLFSYDNLDGKYVDAVAKGAFAP